MPDPSHKMEQPTNETTSSGQEPAHIPLEPEQTYVEPVQRAVTYAAINPGSEHADANPYDVRRSRSISASGMGRWRSSTSSHASQKEERDPNLDLTLPYRTLTSAANLDEYRVETREGEIEGPVEPDGQTHYKLVTFKPNDPENPKNWSKAYKWYCTMVVAITCFVVAFASSVITADIKGVCDEFHVSEEVALLSITVFVVGFGVGPMIFAPLSEIYGRRII